MTTTKSTKQMTSDQNITSSPAGQLRAAINGWNRRSAVAALAALGSLATLGAGCGPEFDPASLVESTRVVGARVEVQGDELRSTPAAGESATVTWLVTAPDTTPSLRWIFALCAPGGRGKLSCSGEPISLFPGSENPPRMTVTVPDAATLGSASSLLLYGRICDNSMPTFDPESGVPTCAGGEQGTTATVAIKVQTGDDANRNPTAEHGLTFDGQPWVAAAPGDDPCATDRRVAAGTEDHVIGIGTAGADRESYVGMQGDPPVATSMRESLQISQFTTAGKLKNAYAFVEAANPDAAPVAEAKWNAPKVDDVSADTTVSFTFVVRDDRGGVDWTTRTLCVSP